MMQTCVSNMTSIILNLHFLSQPSSAPGMTALETFPDGANVGRWLSTALAKGSVEFSINDPHPSRSSFLVIPVIPNLDLEPKHGLPS